MRCAQVSDSTAGFKNGRFWGALDSTGRLSFLIGFFEGLGAEAFPKVGDYSSGLSYGETVKGIDPFYEDPSNAPVPIVSAMVVVKRKVEGVPPDEVARRIAAVRKVWSEAVAKEKAAAK